MKHFLLFLTFTFSLLHAELIRQDGYVQDLTTQLDWQDDYSDNKDVVKTALWDEAVRYCDNLSLDGFDDWRLPTNQELLTLVDYETDSPAISKVFVNAAGFYYWSQTTYMMDKTFAWGVDFADGRTNIGNKSKVKTFVRCVRSK
ncbi:MAG: DUF1566 domain-containing protein [Epsilonproteobacteria bacterium]|nr:DUF1566 domain-containing protein [Campylobacterota bacterium]